MKMNARTSVLFLTAWIGCVTASGYAAPEADLYVAPDGNDAWSGKLSAPNLPRTDGPLATLTRARDLIRAARTEAAEAKPRTVLIRVLPVGLHES